MMVVELLDGEIVRLSGFSLREAWRIMKTSYGDEIFSMRWVENTPK